MWDQLCKWTKVCFKARSDIVMVGEIRDEGTAQLAVQASLTGHLVLLCIPIVPCCIPRLLDMGIEPYLLASTIRVVAAQNYQEEFVKIV